MAWKSFPLRSKVQPCFLSCWKEITILISFSVCAVVYGQDSDAFAWVKQPSSTALRLGDDLILDCRVNYLDPQGGSPPPLVYQWMVDGQPIPNKASMFSNHSLFVPRVQESDLSSYTCAVSTSEGAGGPQTTATATVVEAYLEPFLIHPQSKTIKIGDSLILTCVTGSSAPYLEVYWIKNGQQYDEGTQREAAFGDFDTDGLRLQTSMQLEIVASSSGTAGLYRCVAVNRLLDSPVFSLTANVSLESVPSNLPPGIEWTLPPTLVIVEGQELTLDCTSLVSTEPVEIVWFWGRYLVDESKRVYVLPNSSLAFRPLSVRDKGSYSCQASNSKGKTHSPAVDLVIAYLGMKFQEEPSDYFALYHEDVVLKCQPPDSLPAAQVSWYKDFTLLNVSARLDTEIKKGDLHLHSVTRHDVGQYYCVAVNQMTTPSSRTSRVATLTIEGPPQMVQPPSRTRLMKGSLLHLACLAESEPAPSVSWTFEGRSLQGDPHISIINGGQEVWIPSIGKAWEGEFTCLCSNKYGSTTASAIVTVIVPPVSLHPLGEMTVASGASITVPCPVDGSPDPVVHWLHNGTLIHEREETGHGNLVWRHDDLDLIIDHVTPEYSGSYKCVARNEGGTVESSGTLVVYVGPYFLETPQDVDKVSGQTGFMSCRVGGNPLPTVHWLLNGSLPIRGHLSADNLTLTFPSIGWEDVGVYTCVAQNLVSTQQKKASVSLLIPPMIVSTHQPPNPVQIKTEMILSCAASGIPTPTIEWTHQDLPLQPTLDGRIRFPMMGMLVVEWVQEQDAGLYKCVAKSSAGSNTASMAVSVYGRPESPTLLAAVPLSSSSVYLLWESPPQDEARGAPPGLVDSYTIFYRSKSSELALQYGEPLPANKTRVEVMSLLPNTAYVFYLTAANKAGNSLASNLMTALTFHHAPSPPSNLQASHLSPYSATISWETPIQPNGVIRLYQLRYRQANISRPYQTVDIRSPTSPSQQVVIDSLRPHVTYTLQARAATQHEDNTLWGNYSSALIFRTKMAAPSLSPQVVRASPVDANSIMVTWKPVPELGRNGPITGYLLTCLDASKAVVATHTVSQAITRKTVFGLSPWRIYWFEVKGHNPLGFGPPAELVMARTLPIAPVAIPQDITVSSQTDTNITLAWKPLPASSITCNVTSYSLRHRLASHPSWSTLHVPSSQIEYTMGDLTPWTEYEFSLAAFTSTVTPGLGPFTHTVVASTLQGESTPVTALSFSSTSTSISLSWKPPVDVKGDLIGYSITYHPVDDEDVSTTFIIPANTTTASLTSDLLSDTTYNVSIAALNQAGAGLRTVLLINTLPLPTPSTTDTATEASHIHDADNEDDDEEGDEVEESHSTATELYFQADDNDDKEQSVEKTNLAPIVAGSIVGAVALVVLVIFICAQCKKYRRKQRDSYVVGEEEGGNQHYIQGQDFHSSISSRSPTTAQTSTTYTTSTTSTTLSPPSAIDTYTADGTDNVPNPNTTTTTGPAVLEVETAAYHHKNSSPSSVIHYQKNQSSSSVDVDSNISGGQGFGHVTIVQSADGSSNNRGKKDQTSKRTPVSGLKQFTKSSLHLPRRYSRLKEEGQGKDKVLNSGPVGESSSTHRDREGMPGEDRPDEDSLSVTSDTLKRRSRMRSESAAAIAALKNSHMISLDDSDVLVDNDEINTEVVFNERTVL